MNVLKSIWETVCRLLDFNIQSWSTLRIKYTKGKSYGMFYNKDK